LLLTAQSALLPVIHRIPCEKLLIDAQSIMHELDTLAPIDVLYQLLTAGAGQVTQWFKSGAYIVDA
ncbi:MAG: hypothetical protein B6D79_01835, partial [gamma proteobacterium symbiont of Ctena orbiculata]